eukprot:2347609-Prymnesium_polylepis.1
MSNVSPVRLGRNWEQATGSQAVFAPTVTALFACSCRRRASRGSMLRRSVCGTLSLGILCQESSSFYPHTP